MSITTSVKKIAKIIAAVIIVCFGLVLLYKALKWAVSLYEIHELTGPICNFIMLRVIGMLFTFEGYIERCRLKKEADIVPMVMGILFWLTSSMIIGYFFFTDQRANFIAMYSLISFGMVMTYFPRLMNAYRKK